MWHEGELEAEDVVEGPVHAGVSWVEAAQLTIAAAQSDGFFYKVDTGNLDERSDDDGS